MSCGIWTWPDDRKVWAGHGKNHTFEPNQYQSDVDGQITDHHVLAGSVYVSQWVASMLSLFMLVCTCDVVTEEFLRQAEISSSPTPLLLTNANTKTFLICIFPCLVCR